MAEVVIEATNCGLIANDPGSGTYNEVHDASLGYALDQYDYLYIGQTYSPPPNDDFAVNRGGVNFDISGIPTNATITAATLSLMGQFDESNTDFYITIVSGADLGDTFVDNDYGDLLSAIISFGSITTIGLLLEDWNIITLNAAGLAALQSALSSGVIRFGLRSSRDISTTNPKGNGGYWLEYCRLYGMMTDKKSKLTITYTVPWIPKVCIM